MNVPVTPNGIASLLMQSWALGFTTAVTADLLDSMFGTHMHASLITEYFERLNVAYINAAMIHSV